LFGAQGYLQDLLKDFQITNSASKPKVLQRFARHPLILRAVYSGQFLVGNGFQQVMRSVFRS